MSYPIRIESNKNSRLKDVDLDNIPFGKLFSDHMLNCEYKDGKWSDIQIESYKPILLSPATSAIHYGQSVFEGLKAYKHSNGDAYIFRPYDNFRRLNQSAERMCMPALPEEIFIDGLKELIRLDKDWIPTSEGSALYIRPFIFATDEFLGIKPSDNYKYMVFTCPVGAYYPEPISVKIETKYVRAFKGGAGYAKAAGNYGAALYPAYLQQQKGYRQLIWTDGVEFSSIQESGTMNIFFVIDGKVITPIADGTILEGITRNSVIQILKDHGVEVEERKITVDEVLQSHSKGILEEVFGTGTAATIAHIIKIGHDNGDIELPPMEERKISNLVYDQLEGIKFGKYPDKYNWLFKV